jgi:hypothetical protein
MLVNSANWLLEPYDGTGSSSGKIAAIRLVK